MVDPGAPTQVEVAVGVLPFLAAGIDPNRPDVQRARRPLGDLPALEAPEQIPEPFGRELHAALDGPSARRARLAAARRDGMDGRRPARPDALLADFDAVRNRLHAVATEHLGSRRLLAVTDLRAPALRDTYDATAAPFYVRHAGAQGDPFPHLRQLTAPRAPSTSRPRTSPARSRRAPPPPPQAASSPPPSAAARLAPGATTRAKVVVRAPRHRGQPRLDGNVIEAERRVIRPPRRRASPARRARRRGRVAGASHRSRRSRARRPPDRRAPRVQPAGSSASRPMSAPSSIARGQALRRQLADPDDQVAAGIRHHAQVLERELAERLRTRSAAPGHPAPARARRGGRRGRA